MAHLDKKNLERWGYLFKDERTRATPPMYNNCQDNLRHGKDNNQHTSLRGRREKSNFDFLLAQLISKLDHRIPGSLTQRKKYIYKFQHSYSTWYQRFFCIRRYHQSNELGRRHRPTPGYGDRF